MPYFPGIPPENIDDFRRWLGDELNSINDGVIDAQAFNSFEILTTPPDKPVIGEIVYASGALGSPPIGWDPGAGEGMYEYTNLGWAKLGGGNGNVVPTSHSALQDLLADDHPQYLTETRGDARYYLKAIIDAHFNNSNNPHVTTVVNLDDTVITAVADNDVLSWDALTTKWINTANTGGPSVLTNVQLDGGTAVSDYLITQNIDGGGATAVYLPADILDGGSA